MRAYCTVGGRTANLNTGQELSRDMTAANYGKAVPGDIL